jgi:hypothetical protein
MRKAHTDLVIRGGMTSQLQVLYVVANKPFKDHLWQLYSDCFPKENHTLAPGGEMKKPSVTVLGEWILNVWGRISSESVIAGFKYAASPVP